MCFFYRTIFAKNANSLSWDNNLLPEGYTAIPTLSSGALKYRMSEQFNDSLLSRWPGGLRRLSGASMRGSRRTAPHQECQAGAEGGGCSVGHVTSDIYLSISWFMPWQLIDLGINSTSNNVTSYRLEIMVAVHDLKGRMGLMPQLRLELMVVVHDLKGSRGLMPHLRLLGQLITQKGWVVCLELFVVL